MKWFILQEWNEYAGWYDYPDYPRRFNTRKRAIDEMKKSKQEQKGVKNPYKYRVITREEVVVS